jgi:glyoxylase-like metal-dependent hydrolase (beta-lactamase superfamily II)
VRRDASGALLARLTPWVMLLVACAAASTSIAQQRRAQPPQSLRLYVFDCGSLNIPDITPYQLKKEELATTYMAVPCFLVAHPKGTLAWDVGAVPDSAFKPGGGPATLRYATAPKPFAAQLAEVGYAPADITFLALSHFHWDHIGNANLFAGATWLVQKPERDIMFTEPFSPGSGRELVIDHPPHQRKVHVEVSSNEAAARFHQDGYRGLRWRPLSDRGAPPLVQRERA